MCNFSQSGLQRYDYFLTYASVLIYLGKDILNERERPVSDISPYHYPTTHLSYTSFSPSLSLAYPLLKFARLSHTLTATCV